MFGVAHPREEFHDDTANPKSVGWFLKKHDVMALRRNCMCHIVIGGEDNGWNSHFCLAPQILNDGQSGFAILEPIVGDDEIRLA